MSFPPPPDSESPQAMDGAAGPAPQVVIVGASARAAAFSAIRAGLQPLCFDRFADLDLRAFAESHAVEDYPGGILNRLQDWPELPVVYTGAMENHPGVLGEIARRQPVLGSDAAALAAVRDPLRVREVLASSHVPGLDVRGSTDPPPADATWLLKPLRGAAGRGVCIWDESAADSPTLREPHYFQQRATGVPISAVYVAAQNPRQLRYVGLTRQLIGWAQLNAAPFAWCGSIGPITLDTRGEILARRVGTVLTHRFGLQGLFGCDFIVGDDGEPLLTEVNPRYTGSVELLELLCGSTLFEDHCRASGLDLPENLDSRPVVLPTGSIAGKAVLYSDRNLYAPDTSQWRHISPWQPLPGFADVPRPGTLIRRGAPVCSIFVAATSFDECEQHLITSAASVRALLEDCAEVV